MPKLRGCHTVNFPTNADSLILGLSFKAFAGVALQLETPRHLGVRKGVATARRSTFVTKWFFLIKEYLGDQDS